MIKWMYCIRFDFLRKFAVMCIMVYNGSIHHSHAQEKNPFPLRIAMADSVTGWVAGFMQTGGMKESAGSVPKPLRVPMILKTTNGGIHWYLQTVLQSGHQELIVKDIHALSATQVRVLVSDESDEKHYLINTEDGEQWNASEILLDDVTPRFLRYRSARSGVLLVTDMFNEDRLYSTGDGGNTWQAAGNLPEGKIEFLETDGQELWIVVKKKNDPAPLEIYRSSDLGRTWIQVLSLNAMNNENWTPLGLRILPGKQMLFVQIAKTGQINQFRYVLILSTDRFLSYQSFTIEDSEKEKIQNPIFFTANESKVFLFDLPEFQDKAKEIEYSEIVAVRVSEDGGKKWTQSGILRASLSDVTIAGVNRILVAGKDAALWYSNDKGAHWSEAPVDFRDIFLPFGGSRLAGLSGLDEDLPDDYDDSHSEVQTGFKWESAEDSLQAVSLVSAARHEKYKPDRSVPFAAGIDSVLSTIVQFHKRVRRGAKHVTWDLINEEFRTGEIRIPRYKTIRLKGSVHHSGNARIQNYLWTSSIDGELGRGPELQTHANQLSPGEHYIFFKAMDEQNEWSKPAVIKIIVEDFPKYKFPFYGPWMVGGGGSYYNQGRHIRGIRYALDLNYAEGSEGGDNDFGVPVRASTDGVVIFAGYTKGYGRNVRINYTYAGKNYMTLVSHLATISVNVGDQVKQGQELGTCGSTGRSSAPHIHWELRINDVCVPPEPIFENDSTVIQTLRNGMIYNSDNFYQPEHIVIVDEPEIPGTVLEYKGYNHSYRWCGISRTKTIEAKWKPRLPRSGLYKIQAHINRDHATAIATYRIHTKKGVQEVKINQNKFTWEWATLGIFELDKDDDVYVTLTNESTQRKGMLNFDAIRFVGMWEK